MQCVVVNNLSHALSKPLRVRYCDTFLCRLRGLTFRRYLPPEWGLLLAQRRDNRLDAAIHMLFVFMDLAVVWINSRGEVVDVKLVRPWRLAYYPKRPARYILEIAAERLSEFEIGDLIKLENITI